MSQPRTWTKVLVGVVGASLLMTLPAATSAQGATSATVPVTVTLEDTTGAPLVGWTVFGDYGSGDDDYDGAVTDAQGVAPLRVPPNSTVRLDLRTGPSGESVNLIRDVGGAAVNHYLSVNAGPTGTSTVVTLPPRWGRDYLVLDPQGRPVSGAFIEPRVLVSSEVDDPVHGVYRVGDTRPGTATGLTAVNGRTPRIMWFEPEPDPAVACRLHGTPADCDIDGDGITDGMFVQLGSSSQPPFVTGMSVPYTQWAVAGSAPMTLTVPAVPVIDVVAQRPGQRTGEVVLTVRVRKPSGDSWVPAAGMNLDAGADWKNIDREALRPTDARGITEIRYWRLAGPVTVTVRPSGWAAIPATVTLQPKRGVGFLACQHNPRKGTRARQFLNREWISLVNTSTAAVSLKRWTVSNKSGNRYRFGRYTLRPGATVTLHTGSGRNTTTDRYWGATRQRWAMRDTATLRNRSGDVVARCQWAGDRRDGRKTCLVGAPTG